MPETSATSSSGRTSQLLRELRGLRVSVFHPKDSDAEVLIGHLERIGCTVHNFWPPLPRPPDGSDLVFLAARPDILDLDFSWAAEALSPPVIALIEYENPTVVEFVLRIGAQGILAKPLRTAGVLSSMVLARAAKSHTEDLQKKVSRLEQRLGSLNLIHEAKAVLIRTRQLDETQAYKLIRDQAMSRRVTIEQIAKSIVDANKMLGF
ncbi:MAG: hypothetical protein RI928_1931 [Pseudomonadota bacterium]|jgi:AmiR/NasT family two-component response regulator